MPTWTETSDRYTGEAYTEALSGGYAARVWEDEGEWFVTIVTPDDDTEVWPDHYPTQRTAQDAAAQFLSSAR